MGCLPPIQRRPTRTRNDVTDVSSIWPTPTIGTRSCEIITRSCSNPPGRTSTFRLIARRRSGEVPSCYSIDLPASASTTNMSSESFSAVPRRTTCSSSSMGFSADTPNLLTRWVSLRVASDVLPLLPHACSFECVTKLRPRGLRRLRSSLPSSSS